MTEIQTWNYSNVQDGGDNNGDNDELLIITDN